MIPCTLKTASFAFGNVLKRTVPNHCVSIKHRYYSTEEEHGKSQNSTIEPTTTENTTEEKPFWIIDQEKIQETSRSVKSRSTRAASETRDFKQLLDTLFDSKITSSAPIEKKPVSSDSVIEKRLLDLVLRKGQIYKEKAPLPRSMMKPIYGTSRPKQEVENDDDEDLFEFLDQERSTVTLNWDKQKVASTEFMQAREQEMKLVDQIVSTVSAVDLLTCIQKEINQDKYPKYYPRVLAKAIEHASRKDPYLALTIFELAKTKSMESYVLGCTTKVYDAMLALRWEAWRDIYGMLNLVEEMTVNGVEYSNNSRRIVRQVISEVEAEGVDLDISSEEGQLKSQGIYYDDDEKRACNMMKVLVGKWLIKK